MYGKELADTVTGEAVSGSCHLWTTDNPPGWIISLLAGMALIGYFVCADVRGRLGVAD